MKCGRHSKTKPDQIISRFVFVISVFHCTARKQEIAEIHEIVCVCVQNLEQHL